MSPKRKKKTSKPQNELRCSELCPFKVRSTKRTKMAAAISLKSGQQHRQNLQQSTKMQI